MTRLARILFALALAGLGLQTFIIAAPVPGLEPISGTGPGRTLLAFLTGTALIGMAGALVASSESLARKAALAIAGFMALWLVVLHLPALVANPRSGGAWTVALEVLAIGGAAWTMAGSRWGPVCYAITLPGFCVLHFIYTAYIVSAIPTWIPAPTFWAYATALSFLAASLSILSGVLARLGATLLALMFASWVVLLHLPRALVRPESPNEWASLLIALAMCGGALAVAAARTRPATAITP